MPFPRRLIGGHPGYRAESLALFARMTAPPNQARKRLIDTAIRTMIASGAWANLDVLWMTAAADSQAAKLNWVANSNNLTAVNSPTFTADRGFLGDGVSSYLDPVFAGANMLPASHSAGVWVNIDGADSGCAVGSQTAVSIQPNIGAAAQVYPTDAPVVVNGLGFTGYCRTGTTTYTFEKNAVQSTPSVSSAVSWATAGNARYMVLSQGVLAGGVSLYTASRAAAAFLGVGMTPTQLSSVYSAMQGYLTAVGGA